jgi:hypothetical protein
LAFWAAATPEVTAEDTSAQAALKPVWTSQPETREQSEKGKTMLELRVS